MLVVGRLRGGQDAGDDGRPAAVGEVHVEQHHIGLGAVDAGDGLIDGAGFADDLDLFPQASPDTGAEHGVVVDEEDTDGHRAFRVIGPSG